ncbi:N-acetylmuramoyl-L-alanine amidase [Bacillus glycinifermentans]|uniref:N-acetylmuramoyl-L-alanine amidase n=1 Tax=Bacillus glycinifermentans TaxID=1664069 RepID=A0A0J6ESU4_9BACI|nr:N-acetylmuramoyl-L-alanine amidase [Bacillus glycinifermentans]ATH94889.1 N-acetylmuramoyl-L-alanine amidase [Bacillus glycinifermentans]KMM63576.1 N-acetylmuramoyl-L-alanine amidase [Bacillus glycinifermentans]KRT94525.1 N-acetylmuramoyl-L-alanine amidase [Bacillus glycinifermentans]MEC0486765.1 N-acetylmuramoyl-L-alanine amidase [Bacillus glycinifermentans]MEC0493875.1 N-acetylmuramoyl-L-alanine amidase [Bacillus glycinifermentans]
MKIYLDPGHGGSDPGATGNGLSEKNVTLAIALKINDILLQEYSNTETRLSRTTDKTVSLQERTDDANSWGADLFVSIHINAFDGTAYGYEDYIYSGLSDESATALYQRIIHEEVIKQNGLRDRGMKKANFHVLRETVMHAILTENGFIDHPDDAAKMKSTVWIEQTARGHANGIAKCLGLEKSSATLYKVTMDGGQIGAYQEKDDVLKVISSNWETFQTATIEKR